MSVTPLETTTSLYLFQKTAELEYGATKHMHQVRILDGVKMANGVFSEVTMFTYKDAHESRSQELSNGWREKCTWD